MTDGSASDLRGGDDLYVITLCTASLPMVLRVPFVHELVGFSVFRSRTVEDGRERFRLYVGYFDSASRAHEALAVVRKHYPAAWISVAPRERLGSLDDTLNTAFRSIRQATARVVERQASPPPEVPPPPLPAPPPLTDIVLPRGSGRSTSPSSGSVQRYVVQLDWSAEAIPSEAIPQLAVLRAYNLYRAQLPRAEGFQHALRLGFFKNPHNARQVAEYVRGHFPRVGVVPISEREYARAMELFDRRATPRTEAAAYAAAVADAIAAPPSTAAAAPAAPLAPRPLPAAEMSAPEPNAPQRSREQLLAMLGADALNVEDPEDGFSGAIGDDAVIAPRRQPRNIRSW